MTTATEVQQAYLTTDEAAAYTRRHRDTVLDAARTGELQSVQRAVRGPRQYRIAWLDAWMNGTTAPRRKQRT